MHIIIYIVIILISYVVIFIVVVLVEDVLEYGAIVEV